MKDKKLFYTSLFFLALFILTVIGIFTPLKNIFSAFMAAFFICYFLSKPVKALEKRGVKRVFATAAIYITIISGVGLPAVYYLPKAYGAVCEIYFSLTKFLENIGFKISADIIASGAQRLYGAGMGAARGGAAIAVGAAAAFYILAGKASLKNALREFIPDELAPSVRILWDDVTYSLNSFFKGQLVIAGFLFVLEGGLLYLLKIPHAFALGALGGILDIVPYFGAFLAFMIIATVTLVSAREKILWVLIGFLIIQQIENNVISPKVSSGSCALHPAAVIFALYLGSFGGFWGILLAVPLGCILKRILERMAQAVF